MIDNWNRMSIEAQLPTLLQGGSRQTKKKTDIQIYMKQPCYSGSCVTVFTDSVYIVSCIIALPLYAIIAADMAGKLVTKLNN